MAKRSSRTPMELVANHHGIAINQSNNNKVVNDEAIDDKPERKHDPTIDAEADSIVKGSSSREETLRLEGTLSFFNKAKKNNPGTSAPSLQKQQTRNNRLGKSQTGFSNNRKNLDLLKIDKIVGETKKSRDKYSIVGNEVLDGWRGYIDNDHQQASSLDNYGHHRMVSRMTNAKIKANILRQR